MPGAQMRVASGKEDTMRHRAMVPLLGLVLVLAAPRAALPQSFTFTPLDVPGAGFTEAHGINDAGIHGFLATPAP